MQFTALTDTLNTFVTAFGAGQIRANGLSGGITTALVVIEICLFGLSMASGATQLWDVIRRVLSVGMWLYIVRNFAALAKIFVDSVVAAGLIAGGRDGDVAIVRDPSQIAAMFLEVTNPLINKFERMHWDVGEKITLGVVWVILVLPFLAMALSMFAAVVDYYLVRMLGTVLIPFALNQHTRFLGEKAINGVIGAGLKLMVLSCVLALVEPVLKTCKLDFDCTWNQIWVIFFVTGACAWLTWSAPRAVSTLLFGSASLTAPPLAAAAAGAAMSLAARGSTSFVSMVSNLFKPPPPPRTEPPPPGGGGKGNASGPPKPPAGGPAGPGAAAISGQASPPASAAGAGR